MRLVRQIPVKDGSGRELIIYVVEDRRALWKGRRTMLSTGEAVEAVGDDAFVIAASGERLSKINQEPPE